MSFFSNKQDKSKSYGIVGLGRFGTALAIQLAERGKDILVIDANEDRVKELREYTENAYIIKTLDRKSLEETGIQNCDVAIVCIAEKIDISILVTLHLTAMGISRVIAKASSQEQGEILKKLGAEVVFPERDMAVRLARILEPSKIVNYVELSEEIDITKIIIPQNFVGKSIRGLDFRNQFGFNIIAIEQNRGIITDLSPDYTFMKDDVIFIIGNREKINNFERIVKDN